MSKDFTSRSKPDAARLSLNASLQDLSTRERARLLFQRFQTMPDDLDQIEEEIRELTLYEAMNVAHIGFRLKRIRDQALYRSKSYNNFKDYALNELRITREHAHRCISLVESFAEEWVVRYGSVLLPAVSYIRKGGDGAASELQQFIESEGDDLTRIKVREWVKERTSPHNVGPTSSQPITQDGTKFQAVVQQIDGDIVTLKIRGSLAQLRTALGKQVSFMYEKERV